MNSEEALTIFRETRALLSGHFELRSGLHSNEFFQCAHVLKYPHHAEALCRGAVEKMRAALPDARVDGVISPALGGIPVGHEVGRALGTKHIFAEKQNDKLVLRRGFVIEPGEQYVVAEDVVTRGGRVQETIDIVEARGGVVTAVVVLVDRSGGKAAFNAPLFSLIEMEPQVWAPQECPLCRDQVEVEHPGS
jgi:orotate phosphoribosyltransferase